MEKQKLNNGSYLLDIAEKYFFENVWIFIISPYICKRNQK